MSTENEVIKPEIKKDWRYYVGLMLFIIHLILPVLALIIVPMMGLSAGISTILYSLSIAGGAGRAVDCSGGSAGERQPELPLLQTGRLV